MYFPKNLEFYWGVSGDLKTFNEWNVILLMEEILHQLIWRMSPFFIRFHRFLPSTVLWYLQRKCRSSCLEKIQFWLQVATSHPPCIHCFVLGSSQQQQWAVATKIGSLSLDSHPRDMDIWPFSTKIIFQPSAPAILKISITQDLALGMISDIKRIAGGIYSKGCLFWEFMVCFQPWISPENQDRWEPVAYHPMENNC